MMLTLLIALVAAQQPLDPQLQRQQQQLLQIQQQIDQQQKQLARMIELMDGQELKKSDASKPVCLGELRLVNGIEPRRVPPNPAAVVPLNLFGAVTKPAASCLSAEIQLTASYLDAESNLICSGVIENLATQSSLTQSINLEIRPWNLREFARWRNEPAQFNSGAKRLNCINPDGLAESTSEELKRVSRVRLRATLLPAGGGMSTAEILLDLQR